MTKVQSSTSALNSSRIGCNNCSRLLAKGLSSALCPNHSRGILS